MFLMILFNNSLNVLKNILIIIRKIQVIIRFMQKVLYARAKHNFRLERQRQASWRLCRH